MCGVAQVLEGNLISLHVGLILITVVATESRGDRGSNLLVDDMKGLMRHRWALPQHRPAHIPAESRQARGNHLLVDDKICLREDTLQHNPTQTGATSGGSKESNPLVEDKEILLRDQIILLHLQPTLITVMATEIRSDRGNKLLMGKMKGLMTQRLILLSTTSTMHMNSFNQEVLAGPNHM